MRYKTDDEQTMAEVLEDAGMADILTQPRFILFKMIPREDKITKIPKQINGENASSTDPNTWNTFKKCYRMWKASEGEFDGVGIILGDYFGTKIVGVDFDHVMDAFTGKFTNAEAEIAHGKIQTYGERSVSGTGMHYLYINQDVPEGFKTRTNKTSPFDMEIYEKGRYFTLSGDWINRKKIGTDTDSIKALCEQYLERRVAVRNPNLTVAVNNTTPKGNVKVTGKDWESALALDPQFFALYHGKRPHGNESSDDLALINYLVQYVGRDEKAVYKAFVKSPHYTTKDEYHIRKCEDRSDYLDRTIENAINSFFSGYSFDDVGNSLMFSDRFANELRYVPEWNMWVFWNGKQWEKAADYVAQEKAKLLSDEFHTKIGEYALSNDVKSDIYKAMVAHGKKMRSDRGISAMLKLARSSSITLAEEFDADPLLFNCANGVFDMRNNVLLPHDPSLKCTNISPASYSPTAKCEKFDAFLRKILPDESRKFLQMSVGMAALGKVYEEAMIFMIGKGANGKSTLANILSNAFGDYAITLQPDIITATRDGKTPPDFAAVRGKRIVFLSETDEGDRLSTKALKRLSSNETLAARRLYSMPESFEPSHTVFYSTNHKPRIGSGDLGTWRRIKNLPFEYCFSDAEKDTSFAQKVLEEELEGVFKWCMDGARMFIEHEMKLETPKSVTEATDAYRSNEDLFGQFVAERCIISELTDGTHRSRVKTSDLYREYKEWCTENSAYTKNVSDFNSSISQIAGITQTLSKGYKYWNNISIRDEEEEARREIRGKLNVFA